MRAGWQLPAPGADAAWYVAPPGVPRATAEGTFYISSRGLLLPLEEDFDLEIAQAWRIWIDPPADDKFVASGHPIGCQDQALCLSGAELQFIDWLIDGAVDEWIRG
jgi:hypothetical protein